MIDLSRFERLHAEVSAEKGEFDFFALFLRAEAHRKWDLVISASWIGEDKLSALREFIEMAKPILGDDELLKLSRVVPLERENPWFVELLTTLPAINKVTEFRDVEWFDHEIERAYIFHANEDAILEPVLA